MALTASSLCIGRSSSRGQRRRSPKPTITKRMTERRVRMAKDARLDVRSSILHSPWIAAASLLRRAAVNLDFGVFVKGALRAALGVSAHVSGLRALGINQPALVGLKVFPVSSCTQSRAIVLIVVKHRANVLFEISIIGQLHNHVVIHLGSVMGVPNEDGKQLMRTAQIDLDVLRAFAQENDALVGRL